MANGLTLFPTSEAFVDEEVRHWLGENGLHLPDGAERSEAPTVEDLREILVELGWSFTEERSEDWWHVTEEKTDGEWPPFSALKLANPDGSSAERHWGFRLGPLEGPVEIARRVAARRGPQIAVDHSGGAVCVITAVTTVAEVERALYEQR